MRSRRGRNNFTSTQSSLHPSTPSVVPEIILFLSRRCLPHLFGRLPHQLPSPAFLPEFPDNQNTCFAWSHLALIWGASKHRAPLLLFSQSVNSAMAEPDNMEEEDLFADL